MQFPVSKKRAWTIAPYAAGVRRVLVGMFTVASSFSFALRKGCGLKEVAGGRCEEDLYDTHPFGDSY